MSDSPPVLDPRHPALALRTQPLVHVRSIRSIHVPADGAFGFVCVLAVISPRHTAMTVALLAVWIKVADFNGLAVSVAPHDMSLGIFHCGLSPPNTRSAGVAATRHDDLPPQKWTLFMVPYSSHIPRASNTQCWNATYRSCRIACKFQWMIVNVRCLQMIAPVSTSVFKV